ncbi:MAG TPA: imidazolonepropionase [Candidatus Saccharimonadales bacterium]|nr:imidazolonepropionase [Candidatus Saccharimonadales bacterium]
MADLGIVEGGCLAARAGRIVFAGSRSDFEREVSLAGDAAIVDASDRVVIPGFVDAHTHLAFAGARHEEFAMRLAGASYEELAARGGGILSTVRSTRAASAEVLAEGILERLDTMLLHGTTTCEAKSGYGLTFESEIRLLEALAAAGRTHPVDVVPTFLGAHALPPEYRDDRPGYVALVADRMIPEVARLGLARYCDVFCERSAFGREESRAVLEAGRSNGLALRVHADQLSDSGGAALAAELGAASADHLDHVGEEGIRAMAAAGTAAGLIPGSSFCLRSERQAPARKLIEAGVPVFLATDCNPGTSFTESMIATMTLGCLLADMSVEEAFAAATINGAHSLGIASEAGMLAPGRKADLAILDIPHYAHAVYHYGVNHVSTVIKNGRVAVENRTLVYEDESSGMDPV